MSDKLEAKDAEIQKRIDIASDLLVKNTRQHTEIERLNDACTSWESDFNDVTHQLHELRKESEELKSYLDEEREKNEKQVRMTMNLQAEIERLKAKSAANADHARLANVNRDAMARALKSSQEENTRMRDVVEAAELVKKHHTVQLDNKIVIHPVVWGPFVRALTIQTGDRHV